jgi:hypothetical protein
MYDEDSAIVRLHALLKNKELLEDGENPIEKAIKLISTMESGDKPLPKVLELNQYKTGSFVQIQIPNEIDWIDGRCLERHKLGLSVVTARGEFLVQHKDRIRLQGE